MERILIIGIQGSGKSTFTNKLGKKMNREVIHLDKIYYKSGWQHTQTKQEWRETVTELASKDKWIIDGNYISTLDIRIPVADIIFFFDFNKIVSFYGVVRRIFNRNQPFDKAEGNFNRLSWDLINKIRKFPRNKIISMLESNKKDKKIIIFKNRREVNKYLTTLVE